MLAASAPRELEEQLQALIASTFYFPQDYVKLAFPWGQKGTFLEKETGPDEWQDAALVQISDQFIKIARGEADSNTVRIAVSSGHGVGKTAEMAWVILWFMSTRPNAQVVITAGTKSQLVTKTWREVKKWLDVAINAHWFEWTQTKLVNLHAPELWVANAIPWSENNPQAFAGTHEKYVLYLYDEASTIADNIWETSEGAFTTPGPHLWLAYGNSTTATGRFRDCWGKLRHRWVTFEVDARKSKHADQRLIKEWIADYGIDSDFVRVRVLGLPPRTSTLNFIDLNVVEGAMARVIDRKVAVLPMMPKIFGIDPGGGGQARTVIFPRQGPCTGWGMITDKILNHHHADHMVTAAWLSQQIIAYEPDIVFIDAHGLGKGIYDRLVQLGHSNVVPCYSGDRTQTMEPLIWFNPRTEWWARGRNWLKDGQIPHVPQLRDDLTEIHHYADERHITHLETKELMAKRGVQSPDYGDAFMLTFAQLVPMKPGDQGMQVEPEVV